MKVYQINGETFITNMDMNEEKLKETSNLFYEIYDKPKHEFSRNSNLIKAYQATSDKEKIKYAKKALEEDPDCFEAKVAIALAQPLFLSIKELERILEEEKMRLIRLGILKKKNMGSFASHVEGMSYIDALYDLMLSYIEIQGFKKAISIGEEIMRLDNEYRPHVHSIVVSLYAYFEDEQRIGKVCKNCNRQCIIYFISMMIVYYKKGNFKKAQEYLEVINQINSTFIPYFAGKKIKGEEGKIVLNIVKDMSYLFDSAPHIDEFIAGGGF